MHFPFVVHANHCYHILVAALIRNNQPGLAAFRLGNGYAALKDALASDDARLQRYVTSYSEQYGTPVKRFL